MVTIVAGTIVSSYMRRLWRAAESGAFVCACDTAANEQTIASVANVSAAFFMVLLSVPRKSWMVVAANGEPDGRPKHHTQASASAAVPLVTLSASIIRRIRQANRGQRTRVPHPSFSRVRILNLRAYDYRRAFERRRERNDYKNSGAITNVTVQRSLIKTCSEGPAVSLNGSPTV